MWRSGLKWMFLIIGTMVGGAGYASGRELWQFFGHESGLAILLFVVFFTFSVFITMKISYIHQTTDYLSVLELLLGRKVAKYYDILIFFYLMSTTVVMIAGSGGATFEAVKIYSWVGIVFISIIIVLVFMKGINGAVVLNSFILPLLIVGLLSILIKYNIDEGLSYLIDWKHQKIGIRRLLLQLKYLIDYCGNKCSRGGENKVNW
ncbi:hypothetical protein [Gracilibacillus sp. JCM 18860]|uniref:hypothetical protein n=1 Tax=Gracilibacillus sp. JCM 18860 TaxID=1306159 RepID=UPI000B14303E